jgi:ribonucleoside-diphosphate reductase alpha chain
MVESLYDRLGKERKELQLIKELPRWITTPSYQLLKEKYLDENETLRQRYDCIANTLAQYMPDRYTWQLKFFNLLWNGWLAASTPVLANTGKDKGCPVSCSGGVVGDSVYDFYNSQVEAAMLTKNGFGTSSYLGGIRPRGSKISGLRGFASGVLPVFKDFVQLSKDISQGSQRRGAWAGYLELDHPDAMEIINYINKEPDSANIGWNITDKFIERLNSKDPEAINLYQTALKLKMIHGKGYFNFIDKINRLKPIYFKDLDIVASNLCNEIHLPSNEEYTYTCVLSSLNLSKYNEWRDSQTIFESLVFLYCVALNFVEIGKDISGLEKAVKFTQDNMALGLGVLGYSTYLQDNMIPFESLDAHYFNIDFFSRMQAETQRASRYLAHVFGECKNTEGHKVATTTNIAIAPNLSSSLICGGVSQGIEPIYKNAYIQETAAGKMNRVNSSLLKVMKDRKVYSEKLVKDIIDNSGSVQWVDWLNEHEKQVFKTAFEIDQKAIIRSASTRQRFIDQGQSINLFFSADESEEYISEVHKMAFLDPNVKGLYYIRSEAGVPINKQECIACEG